MPENEKRDNNTGIIVLIVLLLGLIVCCCLATVAMGIAAPAAYLRTSRVPALPGIGRQVEERRTHTRTYEVNTPARVTVRGEVGEIEITGADVSHLRVEAEVTAYGSSVAEARRMGERVAVEIEQQRDGTVSVVTRSPNTARLRTPIVNLRLTVPRESEILLRHGVGAVSVHGIDGVLDLEIGVGEIAVERGSLRGDWSLQTGVGDIRVSLPQDSRFLLHARTGVGDIDSEFKVPGAEAARLGPSQQLDGEVGRLPEHSVHLQTGTGSILLRAR